MRTLAALADKLKNLWAAAGAVLALNLIVCYRLFGIEYLTWFNSIEGTFMAMARILAVHHGRPAWWPFWNAGMPGEYSYFPLLPLMAAAGSIATGLSTARVYHIVLALAYALGPVALMGLVYVLSRSPGRAFLAGLAGTLVSASCLLVPAIRMDSSGWLAQRRLYCLAYYGEDPHIVGMTLAPIALLLLVLYFERKRAWMGALAAVAMGATVATNSFASVMLFFGVFCLLGAGAIRFRVKELGQLAALSLAAYVLIAPWIPPSFLREVAANPGREGDAVVAHRALGLAVVAAGFALLTLLLAWRKAGRYTRFAALFAWLAASVTLLYYYFGWTPLPQSARYQLELDLGFALLVAAVLPGAWLKRAPLWIAVAVAGVAQMANLSAYSAKLLQPANLATQFEYEVAQAFARVAPGERVLATGSPSFWLNDFGDQPQLGGGHTPTAINRQQLVSVFTICNATSYGEKDGTVPILWLKAFGTRAVLVSEEKTRNLYQAFPKPHQFEGLLQEVWRKGGDAIYAVPSRARGLVWVVPSAALVAHAPIHGLDTAEVRRYVAALEDPALPLARARWESWTKAGIEADVAAGQAISLQMNYAPGWRARCEGKPLTVRADGLGLTVIEAPHAGHLAIDLEFTGTRERRLTRMARAMALLGLLAWVLYGARKPRPAISPSGPAPHRVIN
jgi:hypothetical protein